MSVVDRILNGLNEQERLSFDRAYGSFLIHIGAADSSQHRTRFARMLVARAAFAYAQAPFRMSGLYWRFDLRPHDKEELAAEELLDSCEPTTQLES